MAKERDLTPDLPEIHGPKDLVVGDNEVHDVEPEVTKEQVDAIVMQETTPAPDKVNVHETFVALDERVRYVIVPEEGRGSLDLPIHAISGPRVEDFFAEHAAKAEKAEEPAPADPKPATDK